MSTAPDVCFPRHDGSGADPRQTLKARCGEGTGSFRARRKRPAARKSSAGRGAHASTQQRAQRYTSSARAAA